ncbi:hypothetical protein ABZ746_31670 [Streptomyces sp. NPDC020096]
MGSWLDVVTVATAGGTVMAAARLVLLGARDATTGILRRKRSVEVRATERDGSYVVIKTKSQRAAEEFLRKYLDGLERPDGQPPDPDEQPPHPAQEQLPSQSSEVTCD